MKLSKEFIVMFREEAKRAQWEINSWNGKSIDDLVVDYLERKALKPEDFTGAVVLPIDEAKVIFEALLRLPVEGNKAILKKTLIPLKERIEQAEKSYEIK